MEILSTTFTGQLLIAMPDMGDPRFDRAVICMCKHGPEGAMGLIVNKPLPGLGLLGLLDKLDVRLARGVPDRPLLFGGLEVFFYTSGPSCAGRAKPRQGGS